MPGFGQQDYHQSHQAWNESLAGTSTAAASLAAPNALLSAGTFSPALSEQQQQHHHHHQHTNESPSFNDDVLFPQPTTLPTPRSGTDTKRHSPSSSAEDNSPENRVRKRQRNTEAARRYRQRKVDRVTELEEALQAMTRERDELKLKLARSEAEADVLRGMVGRK